MTGSMRICKLKGLMKIAKFVGECLPCLYSSVRIYGKVKFLDPQMPVMSNSSFGYKYSLGEHNSTICFVY
jgi:hypothetical protein